MPGEQAPDRDPADEPGVASEPPPEVLMKIAESMGEELLRGLDAKTLADMAEMARSLAGDDDAPPPPPSPDQARDLANRFQGLDRDVQKKLLDVAERLRQGAPEQRPRPDGQGDAPPPGLDPKELQERLAALDPEVRSRLEDMARAEAQRSGAQQGSAQQPGVQDQPGAPQQPGQQAGAPGAQPGTDPRAQGGTTTESTASSQPLGVGPPTGQRDGETPVASTDPSAPMTPDGAVPGVTPTEAQASSGRKIYAPPPGDPGDPDATAALPDGPDSAAQPTGDQLHGEEEETAGARRRASVPFEQAVRAAEASALEALGRQRVPEAYERAVREYFDRAQRSERPAADPTPR
jgi:hypothetical protein